MVSLFELKQNKCFKAIYKMPFYIKNAFLISILSILITLIYFIYFRYDGGSIKNMIRIFNGLNSNTFNYLENNKYFLNNINYNLYNCGTNDCDTYITSGQYMSECLRISKPCLFQ